MDNHLRASQSACQKYYSLVWYNYTNNNYYCLLGKIRDHSIGISLSKDTLPKTSLSFPGKICVDNDGKRLVVADSGHHRILIVNSEGIVLSTIGGGENCETGFVDGSYQEARFHSPQGVTFENDVIFVADTENHAIRKVGSPNARCFNSEVCHVNCWFEHCFRVILKYPSHRHFIS